jgi:hypothetical protein
MVNNISVEMHQLTQTTNAAKESGSSFFSGMLSSAGGFIAANVVGAITSQVSNFVGSIGTVTMAEQDQMAQLQASLVSTNGAAGVTIDQLTNLAHAQADQTKFSVAQTEAIEKVGLTFTSINKDIFPQTVQLAEDMAAKLGIQGSQAMTMLGKASDDPLKGMAALHKTGTSFTEQQVEQIKALTASGDKLGAYQIILHEVAAEYGGSATAAAKTFSGQQEVLAHQMDEVKVKIGTAVLPILGQLTGMISANVIPVLSTFADWFAAKLPVAIDYVTTTVIPNLMSAWQSIKPSVDMVIGVIGQVIASFQAGGQGATTLGTTITTLQGYWQQLQPVIVNVVTAISAVVMAVFGVIQTFIQAHGAEISATMTDAWARIQEIIKTGIELYNAVVPPVLRAIAGFIKAHGTEIQAILSAVWSAIKAVIDVALTLIQGIITVALDLIHGNWAKAWEDIKAMSARIVEDLIALIRANLEILKTVFGGAIKWISDEWNALPGQLKDVGSAIVSAIQSGFESAWESFKSSMLKKLQDLRNQLPFSEPKDSNSPLYGLSRSGAAIVGNLQLGIDTAPKLAIGGALAQGSARVSSGSSGQSTGQSGGSTVHHWNIDARGSALSAGQFKKVIEDVMDKKGAKALSRIRTGN